jgi:K+-transporting ATPase ATPase C chain
MSFLHSPALRQHVAAVRALAVLTVVLGLAYPLAMTGVAQVTFPGSADGSLVEVDGRVVGSELLGQAFTDADGHPRREYFQSRPSAAGEGYDPLASGASNLAPTSRDLLQAVRDRRAAVARLEGVPPRRVPPDALLASGSGLDPHISPRYARLQAPRVAAERGVPLGRVLGLVARATSGRTFGILGEPRVNVLQLNIALDRLGEG